MPNASQLPLQIVVAAHPPLHTSEADHQTALRNIYEPLLQALHRHPEVRLTLHFGGPLLDYLARHQEATLLGLGALRQRGQIEILGGLFYGGLVSHLPEQDVRGQIEMAREFWESFLG
ncbi:MAG: hypothetical protein EOO40_10010, partial [Deltaproteobacteria bacterium]